MESEFLRRFPKYFWFIFLFIQTLFKRWVSNKLSYTSHLYLIFSTIFYGILLFAVKQNALKSWWQQLIKKTLDLQWQNRSTTHVFMKTKILKQYAFCMSSQINVDNKQLVSSFSWNNLFLKTALSESYILMIDWYSDAKKKKSLDVVGVYKTEFCVKNNLL